MSSAAPDLSLHPSGIVPNIDNVVAQFSLGCEVDLKQVTLHAKNCEYNPKRYPAVVSRIREPHSTACIFASGKVNVTGTKSEADAKRAATKFAKNVKKADYAASVNDFRVININGTADMGYQLNLASLAYKHGRHVSYDTEISPNALYRMLNPKVTLLIYQSGKVRLLCARKCEQIYKAFENIYPILCEFRKPGAA